MVGIRGMPQPEQERNDEWSWHGDIIPRPRSKITDVRPERRIDSRHVS